MNVVYLLIVIAISQATVLFQFALCSIILLLSSLLEVNIWNIKKKLSLHALLLLGTSLAQP